MEQKNWEKFFQLSYNWIWIGSGKFSKSSIEYLASAVNVLTNTSNILPKTTGDIFQIKFPKNDEKTW